MPKAGYPAGGSGGGGGGGSADYVVKSYLCDETIAIGEPVRIVQSGDNPTYTNPGRVVRALANQATIINDVYAIGIARESGNIGDTIEVITFGTATALFEEALTTANLGKPVFLSATTRGRATMLAPLEVLNNAFILLGTLETTGGVINCDPTISNIPDFTGAGRTAIIEPPGPTFEKTAAGVGLAAKTFAAFTDSNTLISSYAAVVNTVISGTPTWSGSGIGPYTSTASDGDVGVLSLNALDAVGNILASAIHGYQREV